MTATTTFTVPTHWFLVAPCGCVEGYAIGGIRRPTADAAHALLTPRKRERDREIKNGWTVRGATEEELARLSEISNTQCPHRAEPTA